MLFRHLTTTFLATFPFLSSRLVTVVAAPCCNPELKFATQEYLEHILTNYLNLWGGDLSLLNSTIAPALTFHGDRFPLHGGQGSAQEGPSINSSAAFESFVTGTRSGFESYGFRIDRWVGHGNMVVVRWILEGVLGQNFATIIPTTLHAGDSVTYNGTEYLTLDPCTGLITEIDSAQDLITFFFNLGLNINLVPI